MKNERKSFMERSFGAWLSEFIDWMLTLKSFFPFSTAASLSFSFLKPAGTKRRVMTQKKLVSRECWWWKDFVELVVASNAQFSTEESLLCWASDSCECNSLCNIHQLYRLTLLEFLIDVKMLNLIESFFLSLCFHVEAPSKGPFLHACLERPSFFKAHKRASKRI